MRLIIILPIMTDAWDKVSRFASECPKITAFLAISTVIATGMLLIFRRLNKQEKRENAAKAKFVEDELLGPSESTEPVKSEVGMNIQAN